MKKAATSFQAPPGSVCIYAIGFDLPNAARISDLRYLMDNYSIALKTKNGLMSCVPVSDLTCKSWTSFRQIMGLHSPRAEKGDAVEVGLMWYPGTPEPTPEFETLDLQIVVVFSDGVRWTATQSRNWNFPATEAPPDPRGELPGAPTPQETAKNAPVECRECQNAAQVAAVFGPGYADKCGRHSENVSGMVRPPVRCSDCQGLIGDQHKPSCHRQGLITGTSDYEARR